MNSAMLSLLSLAVLLAVVHSFCPVASPRCAGYTVSTALRAAPDNEAHYSGFDVAKRTLAQRITAVHELSRVEMPVLEDRVGNPLTPNGGPNSNFTVNLGHCISTLTDDLPYLFESPPDMSIFTQDIVLKVISILMHCTLHSIITNTQKPLIETLKSKC
jgi:hypothetical protein